MLLTRSASLWLLCASFCGCFLKALFSFPFFLCVLNDPIFFSLVQVVSIGLDQRNVMVFLLSIKRVLEFCFLDE